MLMEPEFVKNCYSSHVCETPSDQDTESDESKNAMNILL